MGWRPLGRPSQKHAVGQLWLKGGRTCPKPRYKAQLLLCNGALSRARFSVSDKKKNNCHFVIAGRR